MIFVPHQINVQNAGMCIHRKKKNAEIITTLGSGVDGSVLRITTNYDTGGRPYQLTTYNAASSGSVVNQVQEAYNGLGQLADEYQSHSGTVNTSTTPVVVYGYNLMTGGTNNSRLTSMEYPNGRILTYDYGTSAGLNDVISRVINLKDSGVTDATYTYLGLGTVVQKNFPTPGITLDLWGGTSGTYAGLDNFGRIIDQNWQGPSSTTTDRFQYGYDRGSNALYKNNTVVSALSELYHPNSSTSGDDASAYDNLNRVDGFRRGTLSASGNNSSVLDTVSTASSFSNHAEAWSLDALGNWSSTTNAERGSGSLIAVGWLRG